MNLASCNFCPFPEKPCQFLFQFNWDPFWARHEMFNLDFGHFSIQSNLILDNFRISPFSILDNFRISPFSILDNFRLSPFSILYNFWLSPFTD